MGSTTLEKHFPDVDAWIVPLARVGYVAKGVVYGLVGVLAVMAAVGAGGQTTGSRGVIQWISGQPFGRIVLGVLALGIFAYVVWRFAEAIFDAEGEGTDAKGVVKRVGYAVSGVIYAALGVAAASAALGGGGGGSSRTTWTAELMSKPFGVWVVGIAGAIVGVVAIRQLQRAWTASFMRDYDTGEMSDKERTWARRTGQYGLAARGVTFGIIAWFIIRAAAQHDPQQATGGLGAALSTLASQPYGPWLLGVTALGFVSYGVYCLSRAKYRHFSVH